MKPLHDHIARDGFRLRGIAVSRIDAFSDVVFGFALTLLVVSLEVPKSFAELHELLRGFLPFSLTFFMLMLLWFSHYKFFRRFGLHDLTTIWLNSTLLFVLLFFIYPLKFMFNALFQVGVRIDTYAQVREMTVLYAAGFTAVYALFALLYANALRRRGELELTAMETELTRIYVLEEAWNAVIGLVVLGLALVLPAESSPFATFAFLLIFVQKRVLGHRAAGICRRHGVTLPQTRVDM